MADDSEPPRQPERRAAAVRDLIQRRWERLTATLSNPEALRGLARSIATGFIPFVMRWTLRVSLPLIAAGALLHTFPYRGTVGGVPLRVQATLLVHPGLSIDTTVGSWQFPALDGLPVGIHIRPENVDLFDLARNSGIDVEAYVTQLRSDVRDEVPAILTWLLAEILIGLALGLASAAAINMAGRYLRGLPRRPDELRHRLRQLAAAGLATSVVAGYGAASYNPHWVRRSNLTGTLAAAQLFPDQLSAYYDKRSKVVDVLGSVIGIQAELQAQIEQPRMPDTAFRIMYISDMHLSALYPLIAEYARSYDVKLIINTGDESEFATRAELTPDYVAAIGALTRTTPMLWVSGNHDSPDTEAVMAGIPGVHVLGHKTAVVDGFAVTAGVVDAYGLTIGGMPDPRVYGGPGAYGADEHKVTDRLEREAVRTALRSATDGRFDIFATHDPAAADEMRKVLEGRIRQTNSGHTHRQNKASELQHDGGIDLIEGTTGAGGLDNIVRGAERPPIEFSIESVSGDCKFTRILRFQVRSQPGDGSVPESYGNNVTVSTIYFRPQDIEPGRICSTVLGIGQVVAL